MDPKNLFATPMTYRHLRAEFGLGMVASAILLLLHRRQVRWLPAVLLFAYADAIGYVPGAIVFRRRKGARIPTGYYVAYNVMHSAVTGTLVAAVWSKLVRREWALLAIPLHICGDRALFGNIAKPFSVPFEPHAHPVYERVHTLLEIPAEKLPSDAVVVNGGLGAAASASTAPAPSGDFARA